MPFCQRCKFDGAGPVDARRARGVAWLLVLLFLILPGGCDGGSGTDYADLPPVRVMASAYPLGDLVRQVGGQTVSVDWYAERGRRISDYQEHPDRVSTYRPGTQHQRPFREARLVVVDGQADRWALAGLSDRVVNDPAGPVLQLQNLPAGRELVGSGVTGALWLDPLTMAQAARDAAERLATLRPDRAAVLRQRADDLASHLETLIAAPRPRWGKVAVVSLEPTALLARLGIEPVYIAPVPDRVIPDPDRMAREARAAGAEALLLPSDWAQPVQEAWSARTGLPVVIYDPMGASARSDPHRDVISLLSDNVRQLTLPD